MTQLIITGAKNNTHLDENLLFIEKYQNLSNNYAIRDSNNIIKCKNYHHKCEIINPTEVSQAFNTYLKRIQSLPESNFVSHNENWINLFKKPAQFYPSQNENPSLNNKKLNEINSESEKLTSEGSHYLPNWNNLEEPAIENEVTVDDFLIIHEKKGVNANLRNNETLDVITNKNNSPKSNNNKPVEFTSTAQIEETSLHSDTTTKRAENRPFACSKCKMTFKRNLHLKRHYMVTHTVCKNYKCNFCDKMFSRKDYLDKHIGGHQKRNFKLKLLQQGIVVRTKMFSKSDK